MDQGYTFHPFWDLVDAVTDSIDVPQHQRRGRGGGKGNKHERQLARKQDQKYGDLTVSPFSNWGMHWPNFGDFESVLAPAIDIYDTPDAYIVNANVAGASPEEIDVDFDSSTGELKVSGEFNRSHEKDMTPEEAEKYHKEYCMVSERRYGKFERRIRVPNDPQVEEDNIQASINNGILKLVLPKQGRKEPVEKKKIKVTMTSEDEEQKNTAAKGRA